MTEHQKKIIERVKKLLSLGKSDNENESAAALAQAQRLMATHAIEQAMLIEPDIEEQSDEEIVNFTAWDDALDNSRKHATWKGRIAVALSDHNACEIYLRGGSIHLVGRPSDVATVRYLYQYCVREVERLTKLQGRGHGRTWYNNYRLGCCDAIGNHLRDMRKSLYEELRGKAADTDAATVTAGSTALVRVNNAIEKVEARQTSTEKWVKDNMNLGTRSTSYSRHDPGARSKGRADGASINLGSNKGIGAGARKRLGK